METLKILYDHWLIIFGIIITLGLSAAVRKFRKPGLIQKPKGYFLKDLGCKEKFDQEVRDVLRKIKMNILYTKSKNILVKYRQVSVESEEKYEREEAVLERIENMGAIKIIKAKNAWKYVNDYTINNPTTALTAKELDSLKYLKYVGSKNIIFLQVLNKFDEVYKKYESKSINFNQETK